MSSSNGDGAFEAFLEFSSAITGYSKFGLRGTGQAERYFETVTRVVGEQTMSELLDAFGRAMQDNSDAESGERSLRREVFSDAKLGPIARRVIKLWYVGTWHQLPPEWRAVYGERDHDGTFVPAPDSYTEGLLWPTVGANPSGAKPFGYGTWASPPRTDNP